LDDWWCKIVSECLVFSEAKELCGMTKKVEQRDTVLKEQEMTELYQRVTELEQTVHHVRIYATALQQYHARLNRLVLDYKRRREGISISCE
jgi:Na+/phosphate symporter